MIEYLNETVETLQNEAGQTANAGPPSPPSRTPLTHL
jgi:hypothetical protein